MESNLDDQILTMQALVDDNKQSSDQSYEEFNTIFKEKLWLYQDQDKYCTVVSSDSTILNIQGGIKKGKISRSGGTR